MRMVAGQTYIAAPPEAVFAKLSDFERAAECVQAIRRVEMLGPTPTSVGTKFRETRIVFGREATETMEVLEYEPPRRYVLGTDSCGVRCRAEVLLVPRDGGTEVTMTMDILPLTRIAKVMGWLMRPMTKHMAKACAKDLEDVKASFERPTAAPA